MEKAIKIIGYILAAIICGLTGLGTGAAINVCGGESTACGTSILNVSACFLILSLVILCLMLFVGKFKLIMKIAILLIIMYFSFVWAKENLVMKPISTAISTSENSSAKK
jgi:hypothetical protein